MQSKANEKGWLSTLQKGLEGTGTVVAAEPLPLCSAPAKLTCPQAVRAQHAAAHRAPLLSAGRVLGCGTLPTIYSLATRSGQEQQQPDRSSYGWGSGQATQVPLVINRERKAPPEEVLRGVPSSPPGVLVNGLGMGTEAQSLTIPVWLPHCGAHSLTWFPVNRRLDFLSNLLADDQNGAWLGHTDLPRGFGL